jgi:hypothetical protein
VTLVVWYFAIATFVASHAPIVGPFASESDCDRFRLCRVERVYGAKNTSRCWWEARTEHTPAIEAPEAPATPSGDWPCGAVEPLAP